MNIIDLYLEEIRHHLPPRDREDILSEIHSTLMDMIEDRNPNPGKTPDEETVKAVLRSFGSPRKVALQYGARNYLIGPRFFPIYLLILKIVLIVAAALNILGVIVSLIGQSGFEVGILSILAQIVGDFFGSLFVAFGIVTLSFAGIERTTPKEWEIDLDKDWQPENLHQQESQERIKLAELAVNITMNLVLIALLNFFLDRIGIYNLTDSGWRSVPVLSDIFQRYIPWITAYSILEITLNIYLIRKEYWDKYGSTAKIILNVFKIAVTAAIITGPAIISIDPEGWQAMFPNAETTAQGFSQTANIILDVLMGLTIFGLAVDSIKRLYLTFIKGSQAVIDIKAE